MNLTQKTLLLLLQADSVGFANFEDGVFFFKPTDSDWQKLVDEGLIDRNGNFQNGAFHHQPLANPSKLSQDGLNLALETYLSEMRHRFLNGEITPSEGFQDAFNQFSEACNSQVESIEFIAEEPAEFANAFEESPLGTVPETASEAVPEKVKKARKKSA